MINTTPNPNCLLCGRAGEFLYRDLKDSLFGAPGSWALKECRNPQCRILWLDPLPTREDLGKAYHNYHTHLSRESNVRKIIFSLVKRVVTLFEIPFLVMSGLYRQRRQARFMFLTGVTPGKLLDVGCGGGRFLNRMKKKGWIVEGAETDPKAAERVFKKYQIPVKAGDLYQAKYPSASFDAVTLSHMIEHDLDPLKLLREVFRVLKPNGTMVVLTPNIVSLGHRKFGKNWRGLEPPRHIHLFSPNSLRTCAEKEGFSDRDLSVRTFSSDSAGVYQASMELASGSTNLLHLKIIYFIKSLYLQYREYFLTKQYPECGEDIVLIGRKNGEFSKRLPE